MEVKKVLSPAQIAGGSFWGGPIATVYYLRKNYLLIGNEALAQKTLIYGAIFIIFLMAILPFLPEKFPNMVLPLAYCLAARQIAETTQLKKDQIEGSEEYTFESNWKIFGVGILTLLIFLIVAMAVMFALEAASIVSLA
ncbi:hypothetical protein [Agarivorans gilvus]|uniref:Integron gene cassette protein n=1 Tax=Agarivorans gilvus TaxID=680279 RepID=A0ABQ1I458_9ALTE|nr:hypothetical protein [Agarivorans gilvus]GGB14863.1 hypothetical protein GCM10007414_30380 [Agarivorans gilvus]